MKTKRQILETKLRRMIREELSAQDLNTKIKEICPAAKLMKRNPFGGGADTLHGDLIVNAQCPGVGTFEFHSNGLVFAPNRSEGRFLDYPGNLDSQIEKFEQLYQKFKK